MSRMGEGVAKRPMVPFIVLIVITAASLGMIAMNPPSFDMDQESFRPDNEIARASVIINGSFTSTVSIMSMADARNSGGDMFTKEMFSSALAYEMSLAEMKYTDLDGVDRYYAELPMFMILSPVSAVAEATVKYLMGLPAGHPDHLGADTLPDPSDFTTHREYLVEYYQTLIVITDSPLVAPALLKTVAYMALTGADGKKMASLLTNDRVIDNATMSVSASGCMISLMFMDEGLGLIQGGGLAFEKNVISAAKDFNENNTNGPKIMAVGMETMMTDIGSMAQDDISKLLPIALAVILILLLLIYRDASDTLIAILGLLIAVIWTFGISSLAGVGMSTIAIAVPILILALGIDYSLHLVFRYREERGSGKGSKEAIAITMGSVGQALVLATVTTAVAFLSYLTSEMSALADFGLMCAIGIVCAFASMMLLIPTTQVLRDRRAEKKGKDPNEAKRYKKEADEGRDTLGKISGVGGKMAARNPWAVLGMITVIVALFGYSATNLSYDFDMYEFIPEGTDAHDTITYLSDNYSVTTSTSSVLIFADPWKIETIMAIEDSLNEMEAASILGISYQPTGPPDAEYIGTALKAFNEKYGDMDISAHAAALGLTGIGTYRDLYDMVFDDEGLLIRPAGAVAQQYLNIIKVFTPDIAVSAVVGEYEEEPITRMILKMTTDIEGNNDAIIDMRDAVEKACSPLADDIDAKYVMTGQFIIMAVTMKEMNKSQMTSLFVTIALVILILTFVMYCTHRSLLLGAMATIPTLVSVVMVWGTMAALGISLNVMTLTIASLAVGLGVTYGIHISNRFATELKKNDLSPEDAIRKTMRETGKGVFAAALTTVAGFGVMGFSKILPLYQFGIITALAIFFGYIGSIFVLPSLLVIWGRYAKRPKTAPGRWDEHAMRWPSER